MDLYPQECRTTVSKKCIWHSDLTNRHALFFSTLKSTLFPSGLEWLWFHVSTPAVAWIPCQASDMEAAFTNLIQNIKSNPAWLFVQYFKAGPKISIKIGFLWHYLSVFRNRNILHRKNRVSLKFITKACEEFCQVQESRGSQDSVTPYGLSSAGSAASPTLAVSRPTSFVEVAGSSSLLWTPKLHLRTKLMPNLWVLKPWETFTWASQVSLWYKLLKKKCENLKALESGNQDRFN